MFFQQVTLDKKNKGLVNLDIPKIDNDIIMDKCVLDDIAMQCNDDFEVLDLGIEDCNNTIERAFSSLSNGVTNIKNTIKSLESLVEVSNRKNTGSIWEENFTNACNIDMASDVDIDFSNNYCTLPIISNTNISFDFIEIDKTLYPTLITPYENQSEIINVDISKGTTVYCFYNTPQSLNNIKIEFSCEKLLQYEIYTISQDGSYILLDSGTAFNNIEAHFNIVNTDTICIKFKTRDKKTIPIIFNYITSNLIIYKKHGQFKTKVIELHNTKTELQVDIQSNNREALKAYIGFVNNNNDVVWNNADSPVRFNLENKYKKTIDKSQPSFGEVIGENKLVATLSPNAIKPTVKLYSGFGMWHSTLVEGAFINADMSVIEYGPKDIKERKYVDIEDYNFTVRAGQLFILEQTIISEKDIDIEVPLLFANPIGEDKTSMFRFLITLNGERLNSFVDVGESVEAKLLKGRNELQILVNVKMIDDTSAYEVQAVNPINMREHCDNIYHRDLKQATVIAVSKDKDHNLFAISGDKLIVHETNRDTEKFMLKYSTMVDSDIHYKTYMGYMVKAMIMINMYSTDDYNTVVINNIKIKD